MAIQISGNTVINDSRKGTFLSCNVGSYTNSNRPASPSTGDIIFNSDEGALQVWDGTEWTNAGGGALYAIGGATWEVTQSNNLIRYHAFTSSTNLNVIAGSGKVEVLTIAGGGGGGAGRHGGGGGAGGVLAGSGTVSSGNNPVTIGGGGNAMPYANTFSANPVNYTAGTKGSNSSAAGVTASGGGSSHSPGTIKNGGSGSGGGAGGSFINGGSGITGQGNPGGDGSNYSPDINNENRFTSGGGGGTSAAGESPPGPSRYSGVGGNGIPSDSFASPLYPGIPWSIPTSYGTPGPAPGRWFGGGGAGGGGSNPFNTGVISGGAGGGGNGGSGNRATPGTNGTGGGGGGGGFSSSNNYAGGSGGDGIVFVRYILGPTA